jgi:hypothetical protein
MNVLIIVALVVVALPALAAIAATVKSHTMPARAPARVPTDDDRQSHDEPRRRYRDHTHW